MSTRRFTRQNSRATPSARAPSVRGPSPPILDLHNLLNSEVDTTPAARRARGESLPAIVARESTAYGGSGIAKPASLKPTSRAPLEKTLENMLDDDEDEEEMQPPPRPIESRRSKTPSSRPTSSGALPRAIPKQPPPVELEDIDEDDELNNPAYSSKRHTPAPTVGQESTLFNTPSAINGEAEIRTPGANLFGNGSRASPSVPSPRGPFGPQRAPVGQLSGMRPNPRPAQRAAGLHDPREFSFVRARGAPGAKASAPAPPESTFSQFFQSLNENFVDPLLLGLQSVFSYICNNWMFILGVIGSLAIAANCASRLGGYSTGVEESSPSGSRDYHWYGFTDLRHNVGQFLPTQLVNPLDGDAMASIRSLLERMSRAEYDIEHLKRQSSLDTKSINLLEKALPDFIVSTKDKSGKLQIPRDFWNALKDKIREEPWNFETGSGSSTTDVSLNDIKRLAPKLWDEWMETNEAKIRSWNAEDSEQAYNTHIKDSFKKGVLVPKSELVKMIRENYKTIRAEGSEEIKKAITTLQGEMHRGKGEASKSATKEEVNKIVADYVKKALPKAQLEGLAQANLNNNLKQSMNRVNHFSLKTGAVVMPKLNSPNYDFAATRGRWLSRRVLSLIGRGLPRPNVPTEALSPWEEHGDCWCSPGPAPENPGITAPQLAVFTGNNFYPDEIVIEHIPRSATLSPGSTPRELEVFAYIEDGYSRRPLIQQSLNLMPGTTENRWVPEGYIRIGKFTYDHTGPISQAFSFQLQLGDFVGKLGPAFAGGYAPDPLKPFTRKFLVRALSNHGEDFTCFYRVRLHGEVAEETDEDAENASSIDQDEVV